ncbi:MAG TPA: GNAT family N-acetyltransferase [Bellilinea sp.]|nr:GNAT family N-acetyltransferase [Bellilinea sp.]
MIREYDGSLAMCEDVLRIDRESFDEIKLNAAELQERLVKRGNYRVFVAYEGDEPAGYMGVLYASTLHYEGLWVDLLATRPQFRAQGIATELSKEAMRIAREERLEVVTAIVRPTNASSIAVFDKLGFAHSPENFVLLSMGLAALE